LKITDVKTYHAHDGSRNNLFLQVFTDEGIAGVGEPYSIGPDEAIAGVIENMKPWFIGQDPGRIEWLIRRARNTMRFPLGQVAWSAISGIDLALWDIMGKARGAPVYKLLGGPTRDRVRVYHAIYDPDTVKLGENARALMAEGYTAFKTTPFPPGYREMPWQAVVRESARRMETLRKAIGDGPDIGIDVHTVIREPSKAIELVKALVPFRLMFVEEPAGAEFIATTARLRREFRVALATGENLYGAARYAELLDADAVDIIQPDLLCCGGLLEAKKICAIAEAHYVTVAPHNPLGLVSTAASVHLAASINNFVVLEWHGDHKKKKQEFVSPVWKPVNGYFELPKSSGLGIELDLEAIKKYPAKHWNRGFPVGPDGSPGFI
jgi:galactonate dehydratase